MYQRAVWGPLNARGEPESPPHRRPADGNRPSTVGPIRTGRHFRASSMRLVSAGTGDGFPLGPPTRRPPRRQHAPFPFSARSTTRDPCRTAKSRGTHGHHFSAISPSSECGGAPSVVVRRRTRSPRESAMSLRRSDGPPRVPRFRVSRPAPVKRQGFAPAPNRGHPVRPHTPEVFSVHGRPRRRRASAGNARFQPRGRYRPDGRIDQESPRRNATAPRSFGGLRAGFSGADVAPTMSLRPVETRTGGSREPPVPILAPGPTVHYGKSQLANQSKRSLNIRMISSIHWAGFPPANIVYHVFMRNAKLLNLRFRPDVCRRPRGEAIPARRRDH